MSGANHIVGGTVFTGIYLSMWDTNILSQPLFLFFTAFFAILPDIDHTKSPIGTMFYPVAKYLDKKFGHRTITHSLICYALLILLVGTIENIVSPGKRIITSICIWAYGSHLIFDMVTKQGVPLFYPFKKNPCVIPANPDFRFKSSDFRTETIIFMIFILLGYSCKPLFANGFWNTYNKTFSNIKHIWNETRLSENIISVDYKIINEGQSKEGKAYVIEATQSTLLLYDKSFFKVDNNTTIKRILPLRTRKQLSKNELQFSDISIDSLNKLLKEKMIISLKLQSLLPISFIKDNQPQSSINVNLDYVTNPVLKSQNIDSTDLNVAKEIAEINLQIKIENEKFQAESTAYQIQKNKADTLLIQTEENINSHDLAIKEKALKEIDNVRKSVNQISQPIFNNNKMLMLRIHFLNQKLNIKKEQKITGYLSFYTIN